MESLALFQRGQTFNSMTKRTRRVLYGARRRADSTDPGAERASTFGADGADGAFPGVSASSVGADGALHGADGALLFDPSFLI